jgi:DNA-binding beta-propeller fold protein YncE
MNRFCFLAALFVFFCYTNDVCGQSSIETQVIADNLLAPCGIAIQPETGVVFVADSGNGRIIRIVENGIKEEIVGFPKTMSPHHGTEVGPLGITFLDRETLLVGCAIQEGTSNAVSVYRLRERPKAINASNSDSKHDLKATDAKNETEFFWGLAFGGTSLFVTCEGPNEWIASASISERTITDLKPLVSPAALFETKAPSPIVRSPEGFLSVGFAGARDGSPDSLLAFFEEDGKFLGSIRLGLLDVSGLAYGPNQKQLFAIDYSHAQPENGALFRLTESGTSEVCEKHEIMKLSRPTAMAFDSLGNLYVAVCGESKPGSEKNPGSVIKISGLDVLPVPPKRNTKCP